MNYEYNIEIISNQTFIVEEINPLNDFKFIWTDLEIKDFITNHEYFFNDESLKYSLNRIVEWLKLNNPELII